MEQGRATGARGSDIAAHFQKDWNYGNVIHNCHQILGLLRLQEQNLPAAKQHLLDAGNTPGSPQLDSFGPYMVLARELLKIDERQVVLEYLNLVARFWANEKKETEPQFQELKRQHKALLEQWKVEINEGKIPRDRMWRRMP